MGSHICTLSYEYNLFENKWERNIINMPYTIKYYKINRVYPIRIDQEEKQPGSMK